MDLTPGDFHGVRQAQTLEEAQRRLAVVKEKMKVGFRKLALQLHPDHTNGDPEKTELFKLLVTLKNDIEKLQVEHRPQRPQVPPMRAAEPMPIRVVVINYYPRGPQAPTVSPRPRAPGQQAVAAATMHPGSGVPYVRVR